MARNLTYADTKKQSLTVYGQFGERVWIPNTKINAALPRFNANDLRNVGIGKILVLAAMGESLEEQIPVLQKYRDRYDLLCCDKTFGHLMKMGIRPDYVMICDANIPYRWIEKWIDKTGDIKLIATAYANTEWTKNWKGPRYFYINKDAIESEKVFLPILGFDSRVIMASSNVSNAMTVFFTGYDEKFHVNWAAYEKYLLVGYDYSWRPKNIKDGKPGKYYAFEDVEPKRYYMHHITTLDMNRDYVFTSENLLFSARWMYDYIRFFNPPVINCSGRGLLDIPLRNDLESELRKIENYESKTKLIKEAYKVLQSSTVAHKQASEHFEWAREALWR